MSVVAPKYLKKALRVRLKDAEGKVHYSAHTNDAISRGLMGMDRKSLFQVVVDNKLSTRMKPHHNKNDGHFRMILGQVLRMAVRRGTPVTVRGHVVRSLDQPMSLPDGWAEEVMVRRGDNG